MRGVVHSLPLLDALRLGESFAAEGRSLGDLQRYLVGCGFVPNGLTYWRCRRGFDAQLARG